MQAIRSKYAVLVIILAAAVPLALLLKPSQASSDDDEIVITGGGFISYCDAQAGIKQDLSAYGSCEDGCEGNSVSWTGATKRSDPGFEETCSGGNVDSNALFDPSGMQVGSTKTVTASYCGKSDSVTYEVAPPPCSVSLQGAVLCPNTSTTITLTIVNLASCSAPFVWSITPTTGDAQVTISPMSNTETIAAGATKEIDITAGVQAGSPMGTSKDLEVKVKVNSKVSCSTTSAIGVPPASCNAGFAGGTGLEDKPLESFVSIQNEGACTTTFDYTINQIGGDATVAPFGAGMTLDPGQTGTDVFQYILGAGGCPNNADIALDVTVDGATQCESDASVSVWKCPDETAISVPQPGMDCDDSNQDFGGYAKYTFACDGSPIVAAWWFREEVTVTTNTCQFDYNLVATTTCMETALPGPELFDEIKLTGTFIYLIAPCSTSSDQKVFIAPTKEVCEGDDACTYEHTLNLTITHNLTTPASGQLSVSANGTSNTCSWVE